MELGDAPREREPDAHAAVRPSKAGLGLEEQLEHLPDLAGVDAYAVVAHAHDRVAVVRSCGEQDAPAGRREFDGVREQVHHHLKEASGVAVDPQRRRRRIGREGDAALDEARTHRGDCVVDDGSKIDDAPDKLDLVAIDAARFEKIIEQADHVARLPLDDVDLTTGDAFSLCLQERHGRNDRTEGVS